MLRPRHSAIKTKRNGERGYSFQMPLERAKVGEGTSLTKIDKKVEDVIFKTQSTHETWNLKVSIISFMYFQLSLSNASTYLV
jgi:hypothetical protein